MGGQQQTSYTPNSTAAGRNWRKQPHSSCRLDFSVAAIEKIEACRATRIRPRILFATRVTSLPFPNISCVKIFTLMKTETVSMIHLRSLVKIPPWPDEQSDQSSSTARSSRAFVTRSRFCTGVSSPTVTSLSTASETEISRFRQFHRKEVQSGSVPSCFLRPR